jgi:thiol-disulfide isomerase/thioredoxin
MAIIPAEVREQLRLRFDARLSEPVQLQLFTRPGSSRLILPAGLGCATCEDARQILEALRDAAPEKITLELIDVSQSAEIAAAAGVVDVPTIVVSGGTTDGRIRFQGLPTGTEFPALIDAIERASRSETDLTPASLEALARVIEPIELMVFATPT